MAEARRVADWVEVDPWGLGSARAALALLQVLPLPWVLVSSQESKSLGQVVGLVSVASSAWQLAAWAAAVEPRWLVQCYPGSVLAAALAFYFCYHRYCSHSLHPSYGREALAAWAEVCCQLFPRYSSD